MRHLDKLLSRMSKVDILRNMAILVSGSALAQLIGVLAAPALSRIYSPEDFGVLGMLIAITGVIAVVGSLKYETALVIEEDDSNADSLQSLCLLILVIVTLLSTFGLWIASARYSNTSGSELAHILPWGGTIIFLSGLNNIFSFRLNRERKYKVIASASVLRKISTVVVQILLGFLSIATFGLVVGTILGLLVCILVLLPSIKSLTTEIWVPLQKMKLAAAKHYRFALFSAPQNIMNVLSRNVPVFMLGAFFSVGVVGSYYFCMAILQLPGALVRNSVRQVFYKEAAVLIKEDPKKLLRLFRNTTAGLSTLAIPMILIIFVFGPFLFPTIFGEEWHQAGVFSRWMILWVGVSLINPPAVALYNVLGLQKIFAIYDLLLLTFRISALSIGGLFCGVIGAVIIYSIVGVVFNLFLVVHIGSHLLRIQTEK